MRGLVAAGVDGVVLESQLERNLGLVVRSVCAGQVSVPRSLRYAVEPLSLSHRQKQVLALVAAGMTNAQIARRLSLSEDTVKTHLSSAFKRLGVRSRREAAGVVFSSDDGLRQSVMMALEDSADA
jgi:DNA-binding NarL/FixJ family response regulator